ncbi:MAG: hypothetical protein WA915_14895 [Candidatus Aminicenantaceae bacterium]
MSIQDKFVYHHPTMAIFSVENVRKCRIVERLNRFVVLVEIAGKQHSMHINNTGRLEEYLIRGRRAFCTKTEHKGKTVSAIRNGNTIEVSIDNRSVPGYYEMWFSWVTHHKKTGVAWDVKE